MFKCLECGNNEKFMGTVKESGNALIFQNPIDYNKNVNSKRNTDYCKCIDNFDNGVQSNDKTNTLDNIDNDKLNNGIDERLSWMYLVSDKSWKFTARPKICCYCKSTNIKRI